MPGRGRSKRPLYNGPLRRPGQKAGEAYKPSAEEIDSELQMQEQIDRIEADLVEFMESLDVESPAIPPEATDMSSYLTPPTTPGEGQTLQKLVYGHSLKEKRDDEKPPSLPSLPETQSIVEDRIATAVSSTLNPTASEFIPSWAKQAEAPVAPEKPLTIYDVTADDLALESFNNTFYYLSLNPHDFDFLVEELKNNLEIYINEDSTLDKISDCIFDWCIAEPNFRYTGARLATYLHTNLILDPSVGSRKFIHVFLVRCKKELLSSVNIPKTPEEITRVIGFTSFLGELYCVFRTNESSPPLGPLRRALIEMIEVLLGISTEETLITVSKVLKLAGSLLDNASYFGPTDNVEQMGNIFKTIDKICLDDVSTPKKAKEFLLNVIKLRQSNWGQIEVGSPSSTPQKIPFTFPGSSTAYTPPGTPTSPGMTGASAVVAAMSAPASATAWSPDESLKPVTSPEQWDEFWTGEDDEADNELGQYFRQPWSEGEMDDFENEYEAFLVESGQLP